VKFKLAVPRNVLNAHQIDLIEDRLAADLVAAVVENFPNWAARAEAGEISGGEVIIQDTDLTKPIKGLLPGIHVTISLVSYMEGRNFDGLAHSVIGVIKQTQGDDGRFFMKDIKVFVQMSLDRPVVKTGTNEMYSASGDGLSLLEYIG